MVTMQIFLSYYFYILSWAYSSARTQVWSTKVGIEGVTVVNTRLE